jgi:hypothetical protein
MQNDELRMRVQVLNPGNGVVFQADVVAPAELFHAPDSVNAVDGLIGLKTALDYTIDQLGPTTK